MELALRIGTRYCLTIIEAGNPKVLSILRPNTFSIFSFDIISSNS